MGIQQKIILPFALLIIAAVTVAGLISARLAEQIATRDAREDDKKSSMLREMGRVKDILARPIPKTRELLEQISPLFDGRIVLSDANNAPVLHTLTDEQLVQFAGFLKPPAPGSEPFITPADVGQRAYFIVADRRLDRPGYIYLVFDAEKLGPSPAGPTVAIVAVGAASLLVVLAVGFLTARAITRRLKTLASLTNEIALGRFDKSVPAVGNDEIATLADAFNRMQAGLEEYRERLIAVEKMAALGQMSAAVAHEIRNPLNSIAMNVQLMQKDGALDPTALEIIRGEVERLKVVIEEPLRFARSSKPEWVACDLNEICEGTLKFMARQLEHRNIRLEADYAPGLPQIRVDTNGLKQVIMNILLNAADAMPGGGEIKLSTSVSNGRAACFIKDTGRGIAPENRRRVFEPAFTTKPGGTGLGLAISRRIIEEHGGKIGFDTSASGTTFWFDLPAGKPENI